MVQQILNVLIPAAITGIVGIMAAVIKAAGDAAVELINEKKKAAELKNGMDEYNRNICFARDIWRLVDENFRISATLEKTAEAKQKMFAEELKKLLPQLSDNEIAQLRQAVAGEINKLKTAAAA